MYDWSDTIFGHTKSFAICTKYRLTHFGILLTLLLLNSGLGLETDNLSEIAMGAGLQWYDGGSLFQIAYSYGAGAITTSLHANFAMAAAYPSVQCNFENLF